MKRAQMRAWARIKSMPEVKKVIEDKRQGRIMQNNAGKTDKADANSLIMKNK
jgi:hypothetical protein